MSNAKKKILVIEDDAIMEKVAGIRLSRAGFEVKTAASGKEALDELAREAFDLIWLDMILPEGSGFEVLEGLRSMNNMAPVVVFTTLGQEEDKEKIRAFGVKEIFAKAGTNISEVIGYVQKLLQ